ncbi:hypothetical protein Tco_1225562, partial [Tanacetum coccineum]
AGELLEMDPYEEVAQQGQAPQLSHAYVPNPMKLDEHVPVYVPEPEQPEYHVPSDDDIQSMEEDSIDYLDEPEDDNEDLEEEPEEDHTDYPTNGEDGIRSFDETEPFEEDKTAVTPPPPRHYKARISVKPQTPMAASTQALIDAFAAGPPPFLLPPTSPAYDQALLGHRAAMIRIRDDIPKEDMPPWRRFVLTAPPPGCDVAKSSAAAARPSRGQYDFVDTVGIGQGLIRSHGHDVWTIARVVDRAEDVGHEQVRRRESKDFYTQLHDAQTDRREIRLEIDVVRGQRTAYEAELHEVRQAYLSFEAQNRALFARLETLETHMSRMEWQR